MRIKQFFLLSVCLVSAHCAQGQQMYKVVGADGKITFSDRPQAAEKDKLSVMKSYTLREVKAKPVAEKAGVVVRPKAPAQEPVTVPPEIEELMVTIMGLSAFGGRFEIFCSDSETDGRAFSAAALAWKQRNLAAIDQQRRLLMLVVSPTKRAELIAREEKMLTEEISKISGRTAAARKEWCDGVVIELNSGRSDINSPAMMALPIVPYKAK